MAFEGTYYTEPSNKPVQRVEYGFGGIFYTLPDAKGVKVQDRNGRGLKNVRLIAKNAANDYEAITDSAGNAFLFIDDNTEVIVVKDSITKSVNFVSGKNLIVEIDLPFIPN